VGNLPLNREHRHYTNLDCNAQPHRRSAYTAVEAKSDTADHLHWRRVKKYTPLSNTLGNRYIRPSIKGELLATTGHY
jgi:hypothetical protein